MVRPKLIKTAPGDVERTARTAKIDGKKKRCGVCQITKQIKHFDSKREVCNECRKRSSVMRGSQQRLQVARRHRVSFWMKDHLPMIESKPIVTSEMALNEVHIRWMIRRDMPFVHSIESQSFQYPWSEDDFIRCLRNRDCIGMVAERNEEVVGFMIYELHPKTLHVLNFAVHPDARRQGVGRAMVGKLTSKLTPSGRNTIVLEVRETNLIAQLCYRSLGFRAVRVIRDFYHDCNDDAYQMRYRRPTDKEKPDMKT